MEFRISIELPDQREFRLSDNLSEALETYNDYREEAHRSGNEGAVELVIVMESEVFEKPENQSLPAEPITAAGDAAFNANMKSIRRLISTNDFQLSVMKRALEALSEEVDADVGRPLTAAQQYELKMLLGMVDDLLKSPADPKMLHGFTL